MSERRTKRRYAHELYPHADEGEIRSLDVEVPYLYAIAVGLNVWGTGWHDADWRNDEWAALATGYRTNLLIETRRSALLADALLQGKTGQAAWEWAEERLEDETGGCVGDRAAHYGIPFDQIKPYPCGPEPTSHYHSNAGGWQTGADGRESDCEDCTEPVEVPA